jgi:hypothetical protein
MPIVVQWYSIVNPLLDHCPKRRQRRRCLLPFPAPLLAAITAPCPPGDEDGNDGGRRCMRQTAARVEDRTRFLQFRHSGRNPRNGHGLRAGRRPVARLTGRFSRGAAPYEAILWPPSIGDRGPLRRQQRIMSIFVSERLGGGRLGVRIISGTDISYDNRDDQTNTITCLACSSVGTLNGGVGERWTSWRGGGVCRGVEHPTRREGAGTRDISRESVPRGVYARVEKEQTHQ